jgi:hypothetical protein
MKMYSSAFMDFSCTIILSTCQNCSPFSCFSPSKVPRKKMHQRLMREYYTAALITTLLNFPAKAMRCASLSANILKFPEPLLIQ